MAKAKKTVTSENMTAKPKPIKENISDTKNNFKCHECEFVCKKKVTLNKHTNTKHGVKTVTNANCFECSICKDKFKTKSIFLKHKEEHMKEIEGLDISALTNGHEMFECNLCSFESGHEDSIKEHLVDHLNDTKEPENHEKKSILDEYDDDGNYIEEDHNSNSDNDSETDK